MRASFLSVNAFYALDLPALERPANATSIPVSAGNLVMSGALVTKDAVLYLIRDLSTGSPKT